MDEIFGRRDLIAAATLKELSVKSDLRGLVQLTSHLAALALTGSGLLLCWGTWWAVPLFLAHGILINFLYAGQHELSHWTVFRSQSLNELFGRMFGFVLFYPRDFDQVQHFAHHRFTQDWRRDGELARGPYRFGSYVLWMLGPSYWYTRMRRILRFACGIITEPYLPKSRHPGLIREARWHLAGYAAIAALSFMFRSGLAIELWLLPMLVMKPVHQLQNTIEHLGLPHIDSITENTRSTRTNALMRWLAWNMQYHTAHHAFPGVPCYRLRRLHEEIFTSRGRTPPTMSYLGFQRAVLRAFRNGRTEADYADDEAWISDSAQG
ncbi:MAG TPA: fatty acid desaturase [Steroidobacteraceae bacterium]